jgi:hypothetical protein
MFGAYLHDHAYEHVFTSRVRAMGSRLGERYSRMKKVHPYARAASPLYVATQNSSYSK